MDADHAPVEIDAVICAVEHRTGEVFFTAAYVLRLQQRIAELEAQIASTA